MPLECIFSGEALVAVGAGKGLDGQMDPLVALEIVVAVEALGALITLERPIVGCLLLLVGMSQEMGNRGRVATVEALHHSRVDPANECQLPVGIVDVGENWRRAWDIVPI